MSWLENLEGLVRYRRAFEIAGGLTLIVMGLYMLNSRAASGHAAAPPKSAMSSRRLIFRPEAADQGS
jgi:small neutral amino acid transporter SnatA (MarC family)